MKVGLLTATLSRTAGGLYDSVRCLAQNLRASNECNVEVFGLEDGFTSHDIAAWGGVHVNALRVVGPKPLGYAPRLNRVLERAELDLLHSHGLWMFPSLASLSWTGSTRRPHVISPHGMLDPWALQNSRWKKQVARMLFEGAHLRGAACLHALCDAEFEAIRSYGLENPVCVIANGFDIPETTVSSASAWKGRVPDACRVLLYLGRIHPKKGLMNLLLAWSLVRERRPDAKCWVLVIAGWDQGGHLNELEALASRLGLSDSVLFVGPQFGDAKRDTYANADAFVLPSVSEGLPMVVLESWAYGVPVVMTPECNLPEGFAAGAAIKVQSDIAGIAHGLAQLFSSSDQERVAMGNRGLQLVQNRYAWSRIAEEMLSVYRWLLEVGPRPSCVRLD